ncbi:hypothetical protein OIU85_025810 [Salix viminalis]|uniref:Uncharacterized protein n=1 Tax=Salix viminalis TaxID=40686 RepID=A0A9Q0YY10_SALVM|nr:hypothetical protein OIU85_025810 [Salix viminalis]
MKEDRVSEDEDNVAGAKSLGFKGANYEKNKNKNRGNKRGNKIDDPRLQEFLQWNWQEGSQGKKEGREKSIPAEFEIDKGNNDTDEESNDPACDEIVSDMDYFRRRVKKEWSD